MTLHRVAASWAEALGKTAGRADPFQRALLAYAIEGCLAMLYSTVILTVAGWLAGVFWECVAVTATAAVLKALTGGVHLSTPTRCAFLGTAVFVGLGLLARHLPSAGLFPPLVWLLLLLDNLLVWRYAPVETPEKPLTEKQRKILRVSARVAIALLASACIFWQDMPWRTAIVTGSTFQCLSLSVGVRRIVTALDDAFSGMKIRLSRMAKPQERRCAD
ncbi:MAG: accessory gene regulator ArgB-like protein [Bacteroidota bacterium]